MDEYLSEKEQWEWVKGWLRENSLWILAGIGLGASSCRAGSGGAPARTASRSMPASRYMQITEAAARGDKTRAQTLTSELEREHSSSPYVDQARLLSARTAMEAGELDKAADILKSVMEKTKDKQLSIVARLRLARVQLAQNKPDVALATLSAAEPGAFKPAFDEVRGDVLYAKGDKPGALAAYRAAREGAVTQSRGDTQLLDLKIDDLVADNVVAPAVTASAKPEDK